MQAICLPLKNLLYFLLLFDTDSLSEVRIGDNLPQSRRYLRIKHLKIKEHVSSIDCDVKRSTTEVAISTSLIHDIVSVGQGVCAHTSVLKLTLQH